ncbi:hypothetical protein [Leifsonia aquatica]|uniref:hypothetical protein n=1 Tax=Leifsonia aquatica TaxID=144185 RepID=UPI00382E3F60
MDLVELHAGDSGQRLAIEEQQQCGGALECTQGRGWVNESLQVFEALLLGDERCGLSDSVGDLEGGQVAVLHGPSDEGSCKAAGGRAAGEPAVDVGLAAVGGGCAVLAEVGEEIERDRGGLFGGEEGALLQLSGLGQMVHAVEVGPTRVLVDQAAVGGVGGGGLGA